MNERTWRFVEMDQDRWVLEHGDGMSVPVLYSNESHRAFLLAWKEVMLGVAETPAYDILADRRPEALARAVDALRLARDAEAK